MHVGREPLLVDNFSPQRSQVLPLFVCQSRTEVGFMFGGQFGKLFQHCSTSPGQDEFGVAAIFGAALAFDQSLFSQLIDEDDHAARKDAEFLR